MKKILDGFAKAYRRLKETLAANDWFAGFLSLPRCTDGRDNPVVVMLQIDGLSWTQFHRALSQGRLPFIQRLIAERQFYGL